MKLILMKVIANIKPIFQILILIAIGMMPSLLNLSMALAGQFTLNVSQQWVDYVFYIVCISGDVVMGFFFLIMAMITIRKMNKDSIFNKGDVYKNYPYGWYWVCAKILGYTKCNLVLVPIFTQFKLVMRDTFDEYIFEILNEKENDIISVKHQNMLCAATEVNLIIADTYPVDIHQLDKNRMTKPTIFMSRDNITDHNRYSSPNLIKSVVNEISNLPTSIKEVHIFATTNPQNTVGIVKSAFKTGERGSFDKIIVYQQLGANFSRKFKNTGEVVYHRYQV